MIFVKRIIRHDNQFGHFLPIISPKEAAKVNAEQIGKDGDVYDLFVDKGNKRYVLQWIETK